MSLKGQFKKVARESRGVDIGTPQGRRALDEDIDRLFRLLNAGLGPEYLDIEARAALGGHAQGWAFEPELWSQAWTLESEMWLDHWAIEPDLWSQSWALESGLRVACFPIERLADLSWDLKHAWNLNEASGTRADGVGALNLTDVNTVTQAAGAFSASPNSAAFTAANAEALTSADHADFQLDGLTRSWTFACWIYTPSVAAGVGFIMARVNNTSSAQYQLYRNGDNLAFQVLDADGLKGLAVHGAIYALQANVWRALICWYDHLSNGIGMQVGSSVHTGTLIATGPAVLGGAGIQWALGRWGAMSVDPWNGRIDAAHIWHRMLTFDERTRWMRGMEHPLSDQWRYGDPVLGAKTVLSAKLLIDMSTTGSDASNLYTVTVAKNAATTLFEKTTNGAEITAGTVWDLGTPSVSALATADYLAWKIVKTGSPSDIAAARGRLIINYEAA